MSAWTDAGKVPREKLEVLRASRRCQTRSSTRFYRKSGFHGTTRLGPQCHSCARNGGRSCTCRVSSSTSPSSRSLLTSGQAPPFWDLTGYPEHRRAASGGDRLVLQLRYSLSCSRVSVAPVAAGTEAAGNSWKLSLSTLRSGTLQALAAGVNQGRGLLRHPVALHVCGSNDEGANEP